MSTSKKSKRKPTTPARSKATTRAAALAPTAAAHERVCARCMRRPVCCACDAPWFASAAPDAVVDAPRVVPQDVPDFYRARLLVEPAAERRKRLSRARLDSALDAAARARIEPSDRSVALAVLADAAWLAEHRVGADDVGGAALAKLRRAAEEYLETRIASERWSPGKHAPTPYGARSARARELAAIATETKAHVDRCVAGCVKAGRPRHDAHSHAEVAATHLAGALNALVGRGPSYTPDLAAHRELVTALLSKTDAEALVVLALRTAGVDPKTAHDEYGRNIK